MRLKIVLSFICTLPLFVAMAGAGQASRASVIRLTNTADTIVIASANATTVGGTVSAQIHVEQVLKGLPRPGDTLSVVWTLPRGSWPFPSGKAESSNGHGLFFLLDSGRSWSLVPATNGDARWDDTYIHTPATVPQSLRDVASASLPAPASPLDKVLLEVIVASEAGAPTGVDLILAFRESNSPVLAATFARFRSKIDAELRSIGFRGSLAGGDPSVLLTIHQNYATLSSAKGWVPLLQDLTWYYLNPAPEAVQALGQIAVDSTTGMDLRIAAANALAKIHTRPSLQYLAPLLETQNLSLLTAAVGGISGFVNNIPIGGHEPAAGAWKYRNRDTMSHSIFDERAISQRRAYYVDFWKSWWQQNQTELR